jgi:hypothetical protein
VLSSEDYRVLLSTALDGATDSDTSPPNTRTLYTPFLHRQALDPNVTIVLGGRGVGKTVWFQALQDSDLRALAVERYELPVLDRVDASPGFGSSIRREYPSQRRLQTLISQFSAEDIWTAVALFGFGAEELTVLADWDDRVQWVRDNPGGVEDRLLEIDETAGVDRRIRLLLFDAMDRLNSDRALADKLTNGAMRLALTLRTSTRNLRAKIFIREDMFESAGSDFPDASKLTNNKVDLRWDSESLYSLLFHQMSGADSSFASEFSRDANWRPGKAGTRAELERVLGLIASEHMGTNHRKGLTYTWIPNHLADGRGQVSPRSFLSALNEANMQSRATHSSHTKALHWDAIRNGVQKASSIRVLEVGEDTPWVTSALQPLRGQQVPIEVEQVLTLWKEADLDIKLEDQRAQTANLPADDEAQALPTGPTSTRYPNLIDNLKVFGMFTTRADGRLDLPDVYRIAFGVGRRGGVPLLRN